MNALADELVFIARFDAASVETMGLSSLRAWHARAAAWSNRKD